MFHMKHLARKLITISKRKGEKTMREKMVTRSMKVTVAQVLMVNLDTQETATTPVNMANVYKDDKTLMKALNKVYEGTSTKPVHVLSTQVIEKLYGMTEKQFIDNAIELDPETRKPLNGDVIEDEETEEN